MAHHFARWLVVVTLIVASIMAMSGDWRSPYLWALTLVIAALSFRAVFGVLDPELARERFRPPSRGADPMALLWIRLSALATFVIAPLDDRFHWSAPVPPVVRIFGICSVAFGCWLMLQAMAANRFFSSVIRIQSERGHQVVDRGPYATIRHPGYLGMAALAPGFALAVGSWWGLVPAGMYTLLILRRAAIEDRFLHRNLAGYAAYAARVKFRILPAIW